MARSNVTRFLVLSLRMFIVRQHVTYPSIQRKARVTCWYVIHVLMRRQCWGELLLMVAMIQHRAIQGHVSNLMLSPYCYPDHFLVDQLLTHVILHEKGFY